MSNQDAQIAGVMVFVMIFALVTIVGFDWINDYVQDRNEYRAWIEAFQRPEDATTQVIDEKRKVHVQNLEPIGDYGRDSFHFGDTCYVDAGNYAEKVKDDKERVLVRYRMRPTAVSWKECPAGTLFFLDRSDFETMTDRTAQIVEKERQKTWYKDRAHVQGLLQESAHENGGTSAR